jgi:[ribosomal protein S18]-alanine N-acetyltransferase
MSQHQSLYRVRYLRPSDLAQVSWIEERSFSTPWSTQTYLREITRSHYSHMVAVDRIERLPTTHQWQSLWQSLTRRQRFNHVLLAYGGLWHFGDEAHISTIASHPDYRGQGWGELALVAMLRRALTLGVRYVVLEVRVSNKPAQALYRKHGFQVHGIKQGYYFDNDEDAYDMRLVFAQAGNPSAFESSYQQYCKRLGLLDQYTSGHKPA